ncbi:MAG: lipid-A-disaccharide synthase [Saprospiraceae bacterium]|nr:lipid-A-disaccharide synthase [Saprospiraceae bacterium]
MKWYIIAAEASGDLHGSQLIRALKDLHPDSETRGWGGDLMLKEGHQLDVHYRSASFMGFVEVLKNLPKIVKLFRITKKNIDTYKPDAIILVDYPGFNLRMAKWASEKGFKVFYYIAPQLWAWKEKRIEIIKRYVSKLFVILPFEEKYFRERGVNASYYGHPLSKSIQEFKTSAEFIQYKKKLNQPILALLPGSRIQEIKTMLPFFLNAVKDLKGVQIMVAGMTQHKALYTSILVEHSANIELYYDSTYQILSIADFAFVTSGTATLETGLFGVPQIVCYKGNPLSYIIAKRLIKIKYISLVNLILDKAVITELIQDQLNAENLRLELQKLMNPEHKNKILEGYQSLHKLLYNEHSYQSTAKEMLDSLNLRIPIRSHL